MSTVPPAAGTLYLVVGYDGSAPAVRALDAAVNLLHGREGSIEVVYVGHMTAAEMMSADAIAEMEEIFEEMGRTLAAQAAEQLRGREEERWSFHRRQGLVAQELAETAGAVAKAHPGDTVVVVVGSSSQATHRMVGSVAVSLARHAPVPLVVVP
jgi:nucleotide-binding universal stress UspA family protein